MNKAEFSRRVLACQNRLYRVAIAILRADADAQDAAQEALLRAWKHLPSLQDARYFETWLLRILIRECQRALKRRGKRPLPAESHWLENRAAPSDSGADLRDALNQLELKYRLPVVLHYIEGYSYAQVAELLRLSESAAAWRTRQGVEKLRNLLL